MSRRESDFDLADYDHRGELKTPALLVLALAFLGRYPLILALEGLSAYVLGRRGIRFDGLAVPPLDALLSSLPALVVLAVVLLREKLAAKRWAKVLHRYGLAIALATCAVQAALLARVLWLHGDAALNRVVIEGLPIVYCAAYLVRSRKARSYLRARSNAEASDDRR